ncbi:HDIG domain-containing protein [Conexibacter sp. W3-3-2]|uniref:HDIG domain-containing metalloprotein n=1 Tax=Conexibacter sp. W3-3-2 TaxID=2675227 RepID=UPI0012B736B1|nr:HDIG domain-containing metalloprotein [Conexibacter sp. W3-3-2]MTD43339.1 HDIG domain-containing protein [Conexibacter sp. W3-3-2]
MSVPLSRDAAWSLLSEWVQSPSLRRHCRCVELAMTAAARERGLDDAEVELWAVTGLLHDMDYERHPDMDAPDGHPRTALRVLEELDAPPELVRGIASHADFLGVSRDSELEKTLFAVDELSGFVVAVAAVRPEGLRGMTAKSVKKKLKTPAFAAAVSRDDIREGAAALGVELDDHIRFVIGALEPHAAELELEGDAGS